MASARRVAASASRLYAQGYFCGEAVIVAVGSFPAPDDERARKELIRIQNLEVGGERPYAGAMLAPP